MVHHRLYINKTYCNIYNNILKTKLLKRQVEFKKYPKERLRRYCANTEELLKEGKC